MRTRPFSLSALFLLVGAVTPACKPSKIKPAQDNADLSQVVAKVDDTLITVGDVQKGINKQSPFVRARYTTADKKKDFVDNLVRFEVLANEAQRRGFDKDPEVVRVMKQQMISKFLQKDFESTLKVEDVPDADVEKYYKDHTDEFNKKDQVRVSEVLVKDKAKADKVYTEAKALPKNTPVPVAGSEQKTFRDLVTKYSEDDDSKQRGGDLPFLERESTTYPAAVVEAAFKLNEVGDIAPPIKTDKGWVVLRLAQKRPGFSRPLAEVKRQIQQRLFRDTRNKALETFVSNLKKKSNIEMHEENLGKVVIDTGTAGGGEGPAASSLPPGMSSAGGPMMGGGHMVMPGAPGGPGAPPPGTPAARAVLQGKP